MKQCGGIFSTESAKKKHFAGAFHIHYTHEEGEREKDKKSKKNMYKNFAVKRILLFHVQSSSFFFHFSTLSIECASERVLMFARYFLLTLHIFFSCAHCCYCCPVHTHTHTHVYYYEILQRLLLTKIFYQKYSSCLNLIDSNNNKC